MAGAGSNILGYYLAHLGDAVSCSERSDADLVDSYHARTDDTAFTEIVRRHGPVVYRACLRILRNPTDAEDAFQAVFVVFARRTAVFDPSRPLGPWLYGIAVRVAAKARARRDKRATQELRTPMRPTDTSDAGWSDWSGILDEELGRLAVGDRELLVLCDLQGVPHRVASDQLGCPPGSISRRLAAAREALRQRLVRRGVALSMPALVAGLAEEARAGVPAEVAAAVAGAVAVPSAVIEGLASGGFADSSRVFWEKVLASVAVAGGVFAFGGWLATPAAPPPAVVAPRPAPAVVAPRPVSTAWVHDGPVRAVAFTPDGSRLLSSGADGSVRMWDAKTGAVVRTWPGPVAGSLALAVSADGKWIAAEEPGAGVSIRDAETGAVVRTLPGLLVPATAMTFGRDRRVLAMIGDEKCRVLVGLDGKPPPADEAKMADEIDNERCVKAGRGDGVYRPTERTALRMTPNAKSLLVARWWDNHLGLFAQPLQANAGPAPIRTIKEKVRPPVTAVGFSADAAMLVWSDDGGRVRLVGIADGTLVFEHREHAAAVVAFACDEGLVVSADTDGKLVCVRAGPDGTHRAVVLAGTAADVTGLAIRPGGRELAVASRDHRVRRWDLTTGKELPAD